MTRDEVVDLIGTIAKSGTAELLAKLREAQGRGTSEQAAELIGQFGVGFYSSFMVADKVTLVTRGARARHAGARWESNGEGTYTIARGRRRAAGHLGHPAPQARGHRGRAVRLHRPGEDPGDRQAVLGLHHLADPHGRTRTRASVNSMKALWARSQDEVTEEEYTEFYQHVSHDWTGAARDHPLCGGGHLRVPGAAVHARPTRRSTCSCATRKRGVQLYVKRVFIMDDCEALMPEYLRFVKGVVDAHDLSLNVSREILQQDRQIQLIRRRLVKKVLSTVKEMQDERAREVRDVLGGVRPGRQGGPARRPRQPRRDPRDLLVRLDARRREADHAARVRRSG